MKVRVFCLAFFGFTLLGPAVFDPVLSADSVRRIHAAQNPQDEAEINGTYSNHFCTGAPRDC